ncbi:MAG: ABC transporter substrate-binding protein [Alphaproteobacteria bacterium]|nr:ABC transporter substrate-binding protein [Alphaproteobacteria bacterium]
MSRECFIACGTLFVAAGIALFGNLGGAGAEPPTVKLGILQFGTVNWEIDVIEHHGLDHKHGVVLDARRMANKNATAITLNAGETDMIVTDWLWVSRQRDADFDYTFVPYSEAAGSLMVHPDRGINSLVDLDDKVLGVAGGSVDKSWLLLRAYMIEKHGLDPADMVKAIHGAPPLLQEKFLQGEFDGVLNFWNYTARLRAGDSVELLRVQDILPALGVAGRLPLIGYVFRESWAAENPKALQGFLAASAAARKILVESDDEWERLRPMTRAENDAVLASLRQGYRDGVPQTSAATQRDAIAAAFAIVAKLGGRELVGQSTQLASGTVWQGTP